MKTTRKKMLLSSIAMLLVALVALGSATYAWFVADPNSAAQGLKLKTTAAAGLVTRSDSDPAWTHSTALYKDQGNTVLNLDPATQMQTAPDTFWKVEASSATAYGAAAKDMTDPGIRNWTAMATTSKAGTLAASGGVYAEKVYFRLSDGSDATANASKEVKIKGVTITPNTNAGTIKNALRVAIRKGIDDSLLGTWAPVITGANKTLPKKGGDGADKNQPGTPVDFSPALAQAEATFSTAVATGITGLGTAADGYQNYVTVYVYLDGQDTNCWSENVGPQDATQLIDSVKIDFTLA